MKSQNILLVILPVLFAALYCLALAFLDAKGIILIVGAVILLTALAFAFKNSDVFMGIIIVIVGLFPFFISIRVIPGLPKIYGEDAIIIFYILYLSLIYILTRRFTTHNELDYKHGFPLGDKRVLVLMAAFLLAAIIPLLTEARADAAFRNFAETFVLGFIIYCIFSAEISKRNVSPLMSCIAWTTVVLAFLICVEVYMQDNPLMRYVEYFIEDFTYLDPELHRISEAYYRPYAIFFHPSEAGTFLAMGLPFAIYKLRNSSLFLWGPAVVLTAAGIALNYTRGVWLALAITFVLCNYNRIKRLLPLGVLLGALALAIIYVTAGDTPYGKRIFDPTNLYNRLYYWKVGLNIFADTFPFGLGHLNFENRYMEYVNTVRIPAGLDVQQIFVADNVLLTTMVEEGLIGVILLMAIYVGMVINTTKTSRALRLQGDTEDADRLHVFLQAMLIYILAGVFADVQLFAKVTKLFFIVGGMSYAVGRFALESGIEPYPNQERASAPHPGVTPELAHD